MTEPEFIQKRNSLFGKIAHCAFESYNFYHAGYDELTYEAGMKVEMERNDFTVFRQAEFPIYYKGLPSGVNKRMDLVVQDAELGHVILELKALERVGEQQRVQLWSYMKLLNIRHGMLVNFSPKGVYYESYYLNDDTGKCDRI